MNRHGRNTILLLIALGFGFWLIRAVLIQPEFEAPENQTRKIVGMLSPEKQLELWKNEQLAHELEQKFCHDFLIQWSQRKAAVIETMLTGEFTATVPAVPWKERTIDSIVERNRSFPGEEDVRRCSNAEFVSYLLEPPAQLDPISLDASLASFYQSEKGFLIGKILLGMTGMDNNGHLNEFSSVQEVGLKRSERPGEEDQYEIAQWVILEETWKVSPQKFFTEITETSGLDSIKINDHWTPEIANRKTARLTYQVQMAVEDFDNDLDPDVLVCTADGNYFLFENQNGRYRDVSKKIQIEPDSAKGFQISWADVNGDYFPDLILGTQLLISQAGQSFVMTSTQIPPGQVQPVDVNCDGQLDLHITRCNCWPYQFNAPKQATDEHTFLINCGNGQFQTYQIPSRSNLNVASVTAAKWFYFDDDLKPDLLVTRFGQSNEVWINHSDGQNIDFQLVNKLQAEFSANALTTGAAIADFDNNEKLDFIVTQPYSTIAQRILGEIRLDDYPVPPPPESRLGNLGVQFFRGRNPKDIRRDWILEPQSQPR
ncbi:MAG: VCBS repeat-containing protein, partial [Planctomycetota bacterium]